MTLSWPMGSFLTHFPDEVGFWVTKLHVMSKKTSFSFLSQFAHFFLLNRPWVRLSYKIDQTTHKDSRWNFCTFKHLICVEKGSGRAGRVTFGRHNNVSMAKGQAPVPSPAFCYVCNHVKSLNETWNCWRANLRSYNEKDSEFFLLPGAEKSDRSYRWSRIWHKRKVVKKGGIAILTALQSASKRNE